MIQILIFDMDFSITCCFFLSHFLSLVYACARNFSKIASNKMKKKLIKSTKNGKNEVRVWCTLHTMVMVRVARQCDSDMCRVFFRYEQMRSTGRLALTIFLNEMRRVREKKSIYCTKSIITFKPNYKSL